MSVLAMQIEEMRHISWALPTINHLLAHKLCIVVLDVISMLATAANHA
jgi:hypothetical protein